MTAVGKAHAHDSVAGLEQSHINCGISLRAGVRLYVRELCAEQLLCALNCDILDDINVLAAAVVALPGVALGVLVGEYAAHSCHYSRGNDVLAGDKLQISLLALQLQVHCVSDLAVIIAQKTNGVHDIIVHFQKLLS